MNKNLKIFTLTGIFLGLNIALSSFGLPVPGGHLYLNDIVICTAALLLGPAEACIVGGIGSFLGDMLFYPTPMFVSLAVHGLQAYVISVLVHRAQHEKPAAMVALFIGAVIMVVGYSLGRAFIYSTPEYALLKLPYQILQAAVGAVISYLLVYKAGIKQLFLKHITR